MFAPTFYFHFACPLLEDSDVIKCSEETFLFFVRCVKLRFYLVLFLSVNFWYNYKCGIIDVNNNGGKNFSKAFIYSNHYLLYRKLPLQCSNAKPIKYYLQTFCGNEIVIFAQCEKLFIGERCESEATQENRFASNIAVVKEILRLFP